MIRFLKNVGVILFFSALPLAIFEMWAKFRTTTIVRNEGVYEGDEKDPDLGWVLMKNHTQHARQWERTEGKERLIYDVSYVTDKFRRRTVGIPIKNRPHLLLFGCSFTFGEGLADEDTLQYQLARLLPEYDIYNYAVSGWSTANMLSLLRSGRLPQEVNSRSGLALYFYLDVHNLRNISATSAWWTYSFPMYYLDDKGKVRRNGTFKKNRPILSYMNLIFGKAQQLSFFLATLAPEFVSTRNSAPLTAALIDASQQEYENQFDGKFFTYAHPFSNHSNKALEVLNALREDGKDTVVDSKLSWNTSYGLSNLNQHPNGSFNRMLAAEVAAFVRSRDLKNVPRSPRLVSGPRSSLQMKTEF